MIYLSASSIKDFLSCERKYWYRRFHSDQRATSIEADTGTAVHDVIETYWNNSVSGMSRITYYPEIDTVKASQALEIFYEKFVSLLSSKDKIEKKFSIEWTPNVKFVGTMDRITPNGIIYDWKTNKRLPVDLSSDPQFILYNYAYRVMNGRPPASVYFASLTYGRLIKFKYNKTKEDILLDEIIPDMLEHIGRNKFNPTGLYRFTTCRHCFFKEHCHQALDVEDRHELDSTKFNFR